MTKEYTLKSYHAGMEGIKHCYEEERHPRKKSPVTEDVDKEIREALLTFHEDILLKKFPKLELVIETNISRDNK